MNSPAEPRNLKPPTDPGNAQPLHGLLTLEIEPLHIVQVAETPPITLLPDNPIAIHGIRLAPSPIDQDEERKLVHDEPDEGRVRHAIRQPTQERSGCQW